MAEKFKISISAKLNTAESANTIKEQLADLEKELNLKITYDSKAFQNIKDNLNNEIVDFVENTCYEENICPDCFVELETKNYVEARPYGNHEVGEIIYIKYCPECGQEF